MQINDLAKLDVVRQIPQSSKKSHNTAKLPPVPLYTP